MWWSSAPTVELDIEVVACLAAVVAAVKDAVVMHERV